MAVNWNTVADAALAAIDAQPPYAPLTESMQDYRKRLKRAEWNAAGVSILAQAVVTSTVAAPIPVTVVPATGVGATTAPGTATGTIA
mgnify:CR=1 FL=1